MKKLVVNLKVHTASGFGHPHLFQLFDQSENWRSISHDLGSEINYS